MGTKWDGSSLRSTELEGDVAEVDRPDCKEGGDEMELFELLES